MDTTATVPEHITDHPTVIVAHPNGWWTHDHPHEHPDTPEGLKHDPARSHRHDHRWEGCPHHHHPT